MNYEPVIKDFFESLGYIVEKIDEGNDESPDFLVLDGSSSYLVELKTKFVAEEALAQREKILSEGGVHQVMEPLSPKNRFSGIISKAQSQLNAHHLSRESYRVVWLLATGHLAKPAMEQFEATLYGSTAVCDWSDNSNWKTCFFFYNSDFYRYREELDAAIVSTELDAKLLLNPYSAKFESIKISSLPAHLGNAVVDPLKMVAEGDAYIVEGNVDRNDKQAVLKYLREKHNSVKIRDITMNFMSGTMVAPKIDNSN